MAYENKYNWTLGQNKPNSNPIQTQFPGRQNECKLTYNKGLQKKGCFRAPKKQTQFKPNFRKPKIECNLIYNKGLQKK